MSDDVKKRSVAQGVARLKELLFDNEAETLEELDKRLKAMEVLHEAQSREREQQIERLQAMFDRVGTDDSFRTQVFDLIDIAFAQRRKTSRNAFAEWAGSGNASAERLLETAIEYANDRQAFGRPIGKFQAIRHKIAAMATKIEASKQFTYSVAWRVNNGEYPVREISMAKLLSSQMACEVADEVVQIHGGYGYMKEYEVERAWRDLRLNRIGAGTDEVMLEVIGRSYGL